MKQRKDMFADKLRTLRLAQGLTQRALADRLGFSEKTVSKWECGAGVPDIDTLFHIAELFGTGLAALFDEGERYLLGIDGGGTKTALCLATDDGRVLRTVTVGASNPMDLGFEAACAVLKEGIFAVLGGISPSAVACFAGLSGGGNARMRDRLTEFFRSFGFLAVENDSDNRCVMAATLGDGDGVAVILGTGICAFTQKDGQSKRTGGWGYMLDGGGSAYDLGRDALRAYFHAQDGCGAPSALTEEVQRHHPTTTPDELLAYVYAGGKRTVASFAPTVFAAIERGDTAAVEVLERSMRHAAHIIRVAAEDLPEGRVRVCLAGGLTAQPTVLSTLRRLLDGDRYDVSVPSVAPVEGALLLARKLLFAKESCL